jgi:hypothetical protein
MPGSIEDEDVDRVERFEPSGQRRLHRGRTPYIESGGCHPVRAELINESVRRSARRPLATTRQPAWANRSAVATPNPAVAPVISNGLPHPPQHRPSDDMVALYVGLKQAQTFGRCACDPIPIDGSIAILPTQVAAIDPVPPAVMRAFWRHAAAG